MSGPRPEDHRPREAATPPRVFFEWFIHAQEYGEPTRFSLQDTDTGRVFAYGDLDDLPVMDLQEWE